MNYQPFRKNFYIESKEISKIDEEEVKETKKSLQVEIRGRNCPRPIKEWHQVSLYTSLILLLCARETNKHPNELN